VPIVEFRRSKYSFTPSIKLDQAEVSAQLQGPLVRTFKISFEMTLKASVNFDGNVEANEKLKFSHSHRKLLYTVDTTFGVFGLTLGLGYGFDLELSAAISKPSLGVEIPVRVQLCAKFSQFGTSPHIGTCNNHDWGDVHIGNPVWNLPQSHIGISAKAFASAQVIATFDDVLSVYAKATAVIKSGASLALPTHGDKKLASAKATMDFKLELGARAGLKDFQNAIVDTANEIKDAVEAFFGWIAPHNEKEKFCMWQNVHEEFASNALEKWDNAVNDFADWFEWSPDPVVVVERKVVL